MPVISGRMARWRRGLGQLLTVGVEEGVDSVVGFGLDRVAEVVFLPERVELGELLVDRKSVV